MKACYSYILQLCSLKDTAYIPSKDVFKAYYKVKTKDFLRRCQNIFTKAMICWEICSYFVLLASVSYCKVNRKKTLDDKSCFIFLQHCFLDLIWKFPLLLFSVLSVQCHNTESHWTLTVFVHNCHSAVFLVCLFHFPVYVKSIMHILLLILSSKFESFFLVVQCLLIRCLKKLSHTNFFFIIFNYLYFFPSILKSHHLLH